MDRAALDFAIARGIPYAGWCPAGGWAEDHADPPGLLAPYPGLTQTPSRDPAQRTEWNVRDGDATLILACNDGRGPQPGTSLTVEMAQRSGKPYLALPVFEVPDRDAVTSFLGLATRDGLVELNVAGPRESECPGVYARALDYLAAVL